MKILAKELRKQRILSEVILWKAIKGKSLKVEFHRQVPMLEFIVDFYCHELKLVIEIDGSSHQYDESFKDDMMRQQLIENYGVTFIRFLDGDIKNNLENVLKEIYVKIDELMK
ncbi:MAG: endonuclease domain-containing protein [Candidatus Methylacidiphilales bacterium]